MIKILGSIPRVVTVACSGGIDSMVLLDFLSRNHAVNVAFFHHGTETSDRALDFITRECSDRNLNLITKRIEDSSIPLKLSAEEYWRDKRYEFLSQFECVVTGHHLDDVVETWAWSSLHGQSKLLPYRRNNVIRPFLLNRKYDLENWARRKNVRWIEDFSNNDTRYTRNYIRHEFMPNVLRINPGIHTLLRKKLEKRQKIQQTNSSLNTE